MNTGSPLGDVLRAWTLLAPQDAETRARIATILGTVWAPPRLVPEIKLPALRPADPHPTQPVARPSPETAAPTRIPRKISIDITPPSTTEPTIDEVLGTDSMEIQKQLAPFPPKQPLLNPQWMRGIFSSRLSQSVPSRRLDFPRILRHELRAQPLRQLPWRRVLTMSAGVRCYLDAGAPLDILGEDRDQVLRALRALAGFERVAHSFFETVPDAEESRDDDPQSVTAPGAPVLILTDFGHYALPGRRWATPREWQAYLQRERARGTTRIVALTPLAPTNWPALPELDIVLWDWPTGVAKSRHDAH